MGAGDRQFCVYIYIYIHTYTYTYIFVYEGPTREGEGRRGVRWSPIIFIISSSSSNSIIIISSSTSSSSSSSSSIIIIPDGGDIWQRTRYRCLKKALLRRRKLSGNKFSDSQIRGWGAVSAAGLHSDGSRKRNFLFTGSGHAM